jgi:hypothetical protein
MEGSSHVWQQRKAMDIRCGVGGYFAVTYIGWRTDEYQPRRGVEFFWVSAIE